MLQVGQAFEVTGGICHHADGLMDPAHTAFHLHHLFTWAHSVKAICADTQ
jgi:hypothetical protein